MITENNFYEAGFSSLVELLLRSTLQGSVHYSPSIHRREYEVRSLRRDNLRNLCFPFSQRFVRYSPFTIDHSLV